MTTGELISNPHGNASAAAEAATTQKSDQVVRRYFEEAKRSLLRQLFGNKSPLLFTNSERRIYDRIRFAIYLGGETDLYKSFCAEDDDNAGYMGRYVHGLIVCSRMTRIPAVSLMEVLGHEIGHSLDTRNIYRSYYLEDVKDEIRFVVDQPDSYSKKNQAMIDSGLVPEKLEAQILGKSVYPFQDILEFLDSKIAEGFPAVKKSQRNETLADSFGALVVKDYFQSKLGLEAGDSISEEDMVAPFSSVMDEVCGVSDSPFMESETYASFVLRFEGVYMADPYLANLYQCPWLAR